MRGGNRFLLSGALALTVLLAGCGNDPDSTPNLTATPTHVRWEPYQGVQLPHAEEGPTKIDTGAALGFVHEPVGAALAAATHTVRMSIAPDGDWARIVAAEVMPSKGRDEYTLSRVQISVKGPVNPKVAPRLRGYRITEYHDNSAKILVYTSFPDNSIAANHTEVLWSNDDWRLQLPDPASSGRTVDAIAELPKDMVKLEAPL